MAAKLVSPDNAFLGENSEAGTVESINLYTLQVFVARYFHNGDIVMSVIPSGFSERIFEFAFNAEFIYANNAVLAGVPDIPTQNKEKSLGYDVKFEIEKTHSIVRIIALQHKVSRLVDTEGLSNQHFWSATNGPYLAFRLDTAQYNLIQGIASDKNNPMEIYFCAPTFVSLKDLNTRFKKSTVMDGSVWIDVAMAGKITDKDTHSVIYSEDGKKAFRFSESPEKLGVHNPRERASSAQHNKVFDQKTYAKIYELACEALIDSGLKLPDKLRKREPPTIKDVAELLCEYFGVSLLLVLGRNNQSRR